MLRLVHLLEKKLQEFLDLISLRLCYGCKKASAHPENKFYCAYCFDKLQSNWLNKNYSRKYLDFTYQELAEFYDSRIPLYPKIYFATEYGPLTKSLLRHFKYRKPYIAEFWGRFLAQYWQAHADWILSDLNSDELEKFNPQINTERKLRFWISYVPMHESKFKSRSYNQAELVAQEFTQLLNQELKKKSKRYLYQSAKGLAYNQVASYQLLRNYIRRSKATPSLYDKSKQERLAILHEAFSMTPLLRINDSFEKFTDARHASSEKREDILIIIDDISTTGATAMEIYRSLNLTTHPWQEIIFLTVTGRNFTS